MTDILSPLEIYVNWTKSSTDKKLYNSEYTAMLLGEIMDSISYDMKFTLENQDDFPDKFLLTLDF